jgi:hypothetical protein
MDRFPSILSFDKEIFKKQGPPSVQLTENQEHSRKEKGSSGSKRTISNFKIF